jgi:hypothetical protein
MKKDCPECGFAKDSPGCRAMHSKESGAIMGVVYGKAHEKIDERQAVRHTGVGPLPVSAQLGAIHDKEKYGFTTFKGHKVRDLGNGYYATPKGLPVIHDERSRKHFGEMFNAHTD